MSIARRVLLAAIRLYQRWISPRKGFHCAYRVHTGRCGCSALGYRAIRLFGARRGLGVLRLRFEQCALKHALYGPRRFVPRGERGDVDCDCDADACPCDVPDDCLDALDCDGCGERRREGRRKARGDVRQRVRERCVRREAAPLPQNAAAAPAPGAGPARRKT